MPSIGRTLGYIAVMTSLLATGPALARTSDELKALREEVAALQQGQEQMQKELADIKKLVQQLDRPAPSAAAKSAFKPTDIQLGDVAYRGSVNAPVTLVEFSDYHCPYCKRHATSVMPALYDKYISTGKVRFVMREYPIDRLHPRATAASEAVLCAGDQDKYWEMHDSLFRDQKATSDEAMRQQAASIGLDMTAYEACMSSDKFMAQIKADIAEGQKLGVSGTPSFVLGLTDPQDSSKVHLTKFIRGAQSQQAFSTAIEELLKTAASKK